MATTTCRYININYSVKYVHTCVHTCTIYGHMLQIIYVYTECMQNYTNLHTYMYLNEKSEQEEEHSFKDKVDNINTNPRTRGGEYVVYIPEPVIIHTHTV